MSTIIDCKSFNHSLVDLYSFAIDRGKKLKVFQWCEICGAVQVVELCRGKGRRRVIIKMKYPKIYTEKQE